MFFFLEKTSRPQVSHLKTKHVQNNNDCIWNTSIISRAHSFLQAAEFRTNKRICPMLQNFHVSVELYKIWQKWSVTDITLWSAFDYKLSKVALIANARVDFLILSSPFPVLSLMYDSLLTESLRAHCYVFIISHRADFQWFETDK